MSKHLPAPHIPKRRAMGRWERVLDDLRSNDALLAFVGVTFLILAMTVALTIRSFDWNVL